MKLYLICATERTGSSLLADCLVRTGRAGDPSELLHPNIVAALRTRSEVTVLANPLTVTRGTGRQHGRAAVRHPGGEPDARGAKVHWSHVENLARRVSSLDGALAADPGQLLDEVFSGVTAHIWLHRRDRLRQAVSYVRAQNSGLWWRQSSDPDRGIQAEPGRDDSAPAADPADVMRAVELFRTHDAAWSRYFEARGLRPLRVAYEDLVADYERVVGRVLQHIGAGLPAGGKIPPPRLARQADDYSEDLVTRIRASIPGAPLTGQSASVPGAAMPSPLQIVICFPAQRAGVAASLTRCINSMTPHQAAFIGSTGAAAEADLLIAIDGAFPAHEDSRGLAVLTLVTDHLGVDMSFVRDGQPGLVVGNHTAIACAQEHLTVVPEPVWMPAASAEQPATDQVSVFYLPRYAVENMPEASPQHWRSRGVDTTYQVLAKLAARGFIRLSVPEGGTVTAQEACRAIQAAHVVIDETVTGSYHTASLLGLAGASVVVNAMGLRPDITRFFRSCAGDTGANPFTFARLESLEGLLTSLATRGSEALREEGNRNLGWFDRHWSFDEQWDRCWWPAASSALASRPSRAPRRLGAPDLIQRLRTPDISVVIPTLNEGEMLRRTIDGLRASMPAATEFVVVDDHSTDGSPDDVRGIPHVQVLRAAERLGVARGRNYGAVAAGGDVLVFCDAHVIPGDGWLAPLLAALEAPDVGAVTPAVGILGRPDHPPGHGGRWGRWREAASLDWCWIGQLGPEPAPVPLLCGISAMRRTVFKEIHGFDNGMLLYGLEDCEISFHLWSRGYRCLGVPTAVVSHMFKAKHNFPVSWKYVLYNALRLATVHFSTPRVVRLTERLRKNAAFPDAAAMLVESDVWKRRQWIRSERQRDDDWYFKQFHLE